MDMAKWTEQTFGQVKGADSQLSGQQTKEQGQQWAELRSCDGEICNGQQSAKQRPDSTFQGGLLKEYGNKRPLTEVEIFFCQIKPLS